MPQPFSFPAAGSGGVENRASCSRGVLVSLSPPAGDEGDGGVVLSVGVGCCVVYGVSQRGNVIISPDWCVR